MARIGLGRGGSGILSKELSFDFLNPSPGAVRIRITPSGYGFFGLVLCGFLLSINFSNNLLFAMTFLLVSIALVGLYETWSNVKKLFFADWRVEPVFAGQKAVYQIMVLNRSNFVRYAIRGVAPKAESVEQLIKGKEQVGLQLRRQTVKRGELAAAPAAIRSSFPMGIFEARLTTGELPSCLVYPKPAGVQPLPGPGSNQQAHLLAESGSYKDMRRYSPGDPLSRISWKAFARFDELYTKEFDGAQGSGALWLRWDDVQVTGVEERLSQLCRWVLDAHRENREFGLEIPGDKVEPGSEEAHVQRCLQCLARYGGQESAS